MYRTLTAQNSFFTNFHYVEEIRKSLRTRNKWIDYKISTISTFEHSLALGKNCTFSSTKWENEHYFETLSALTLKFRNFKWKTGICVRSAASESKSTLIMPASHGDISIDLRGSLSAQKTCFCRSTSTTWWSYRATFLVLQPLQMFVHFFQLNESEHVVLPIVIIWHSVRGISGALNEHYLKFWALNRALNAEKTRDAPSTKSKFYEH